MDNFEKYFYEAFGGMKRLGPGSEQSTGKAMEYMDKTSNIHILDIGCGVGAHTFLIAKEFPNATITAIDNNPEYIDIFNRKAKEYNVSDRVKGIAMSMFEMDFVDESFDFIWAEGSIYIAGFKKGLSNWKRYLKQKGCLICSEISWLVESPSKECYAFWKEGYAEMDHLSNKIECAKKLGYKEIAHFACPKTDWTDNYYVPLAHNLEGMRNKYQECEEALQVVDMIQQEIDLYHKYGNEYSYVFYVLEKE